MYGNAFSLGMAVLLLGLLRPVAAQTPDVRLTIEIATPARIVLAHLSDTTIRMPRQVPLMDGYRLASRESDCRIFRTQPISCRLILPRLNDTLRFTGLAEAIPAWAHLFLDQLPLRGVASSPIGFEPTSLANLPLTQEEGTEGREVGSEVLYLSWDTRRPSRISRPPLLPRSTGPHEGSVGEGWQAQLSVALVPLEGVVNGDLAECCLNAVVGGSAPSLSG